LLCYFVSLTPTNADLQHNLFRLTLGEKLCLCPKNEGAKRVLDVGTGTGIWAIEYGKRCQSWL